MRRQFGPDLYSLEFGEMHQARVNANMRSAFGDTPERHYTRDELQLIGEDNPSSKPKASAPTTPPSWWSQHRTQLATGVLDAAAPWIQEGLNQTPMFAPTPTPSLPMPPLKKKSNLKPWLLGGGIIVGGVGLIALLFHLSRK